eukprot:TRINITY_DN6285_c0_g1_i4.p1 TRINITY_DN6285_c0_g1~~TRINITY_DN6285_c0_g1_i4.p1  ORF type:complete len:184 (-),score=32.78 TRINITY_DN6285_c0_g1_i4:47-598(-)
MNRQLALRCVGARALCTIRFGGNNYSNRWYSGMSIGDTTCPIVGRDRNTSGEWGGSRSTGYCTEPQKQSVVYNGMSIGDTGPAFRREDGGATRRAGSSTTETHKQQNSCYSGMSISDTTCHVTDRDENNLGDRGGIRRAGFGGNQQQGFSTIGSMGETGSSHQPDLEDEEDIELSNAHDHQIK